MKTKEAIRALVLATLFLLVPAHADFHFMKIVEVFAGTAAAPNAQYVVLQMYVSGQQFVANHALTVYDANGGEVAVVAFSGNVANGDNQATILIATAEAEAFFNLAPDLVMPAELMAAGGKVCFAGSVDCVAWGSWSGSSSGVGTPFNANGGLLSGQAAIRRLDIAGGAITLDAADDTGNSANDFEFGPPEPRNNAGLFGSIPSSVCGNDAIEGLEQCDDGNLVDGDGCSSSCAADIIVSSSVKGDFDGDGRSDVFWRNTRTGQNAIWRSGDSRQPSAVSTVADQAWTVAGVGDFDGDGSSDVLWRNTGTGRNVIWGSGDSGQPSAVATVADQAWIVAGVGDFDGDGSSDVFWRNTSTGRNVIWRSADAGQQPAVAMVTDQAWTVAGVGDFDGDGSSDVFWRNTSTGRNVIWRSADAGQQPAVATVTDQTWIVVGVGDFDGDGSSDVFWRNTSTGRNVIWRSGNAALQQDVATVTDQAWDVARTGDYDGNGTADVFWRNMTSGRNAIWLSANPSTQPAVSTVSDLAWTIVPYEGQAPVVASDPPPAQGPVLTVADEFVIEGNSGTVQMTFVVQLSYAPDAAVTFDIATSGGTADAASDYEPGNLSGERIEAGEVSGTFSVTVFGDTIEEADETFNVNVTNVGGGGATLGDGRARGTIRDDDYTY